ncbi:hypothetical protein FGO68_gene12717 [Halteria grandinella]|uniref:Uncharacterized protein n=1 Tax=Halteria grandinella TaxID=5974 RepID=A0A8J8SVL5_HALGN|nr:hypothetical protein FGO68_gene12717 [Halteria grandinella]
MSKGFEMKYTEMIRQLINISRSQNALSFVNKKFMPRDVIEVHAANAHVVVKDHPFPPPLPKLIPMECEESEQVATIELLCTSNAHMALTQVLEEETRRQNQEMEGPVVPEKLVDPKQAQAAVNEEESTLADDPTQAGKRKLKRGSLDQLAQRRLEEQKEEKKKEIYMNNTASTIQHFSKNTKKETSIHEAMRNQERNQAALSKSLFSQNPFMKEPERKQLQLKVYKSKALEGNTDYRGKPIDVKLKDLIFYMQRDSLLKRSRVLYRSMLFDSKAINN